MHFFEGKDEKKEQKEKNSYFYWTYKTLADELRVHKKSVWNFFQRKIGFDQVEEFMEGSLGHRIPKELGDRILGLKSNPPEDIDEFEYTYPVGKVAEWLGKSPDGLIAMLEVFDLVKYMDSDGRGMRVPRSIFGLLDPYVDLQPQRGYNNE